MNRSISVPETLKVVVARAQEYVAREIATNDRLKWLIAFSAIILYISGALFLAGQVETSRLDLARSLARLSQITAQAEETRWPQRAAEAKAFIGELEKKFWKGDTLGLAEAGFERWIRQTFDNHGVRVRQVQLTRSALVDDELNRGREALSTVQRIRAKIISPLNEPALIRFLEEAANHESWIIVEQLIVRAGRNARLEMDLAIVFRPPGQAQ